jgi:hypothetical protein
MKNLPAKIQISGLSCSDKPAAGKRMICIGCKINYLHNSFFSKYVVFLQTRKNGRIA